MRKVNKLTVLAMTAMLAAALTGCGKDKTKGGGSTEATTEAIEAVVIEDNEDWTTTEVPVVEDVRFTTVEGADALGINFDDNEPDGFATYANTGKFTMYAENGELVADIEKVGTLDYACQLDYDGFTMAKGCVYTLSFDIYSTIEREIEWRVQINGGDYHPYASDHVMISPEKQTVTCEFTMDEDSDPAPRFVLNMGLFEGMTDTPHKVYVDNVSLIVTDSSNAEVIVGAPTPIQVKVNQIGYRPDDVKTVITTSKDDEKFKIVKADTEETVYIGSYGDLSFDKAAQTNTKQGDFTDFKATGKFRIISSPSGASYDFSIGEGLYDDVYKDTILMLYRQRCGSDLNEAIAGSFAHEACHMDNAIVYGSESSATVDVSGGWHDAGDYGRYVVPGAKTIQDLFLSYADYNEDADDIGIPESGNGVPDLLDEARYELDWMFKMQEAESGGVYHKVTCAVFPETVGPNDETDQLIISPISYAATADFAAVMAEASVIYKDIDSDFAAKCLDAAKKAFAFLEANPDMKGFTNPEDIVTGEYPDQKLKDEYLWAAAELYLATKEDTYKTAITAVLDEDKFPMGLGWADVGTYAVYDLALKSEDDTIKQAAVAKLTSEADSLLKECQSESFFMGLGNKYPWGSNMSIANNGELLLMADKAAPNDLYREYAQKHRDYLFGVNGTGYCYVTGYGTLSPESIHHRPSQVLGETAPGYLVGGPDSELEDPYAAAVLYGYAPALSYVDNSQSFSCNEITIYWNSPLIYLLTGLK